MAGIRRNRRLNKCHSCRRLKIKCNETKPRCEYCEATGKVCVYDSPEGTPQARDAGKKTDPRAVCAQGSQDVPQDMASGGHQQRQTKPRKHPHGANQNLDLVSAELINQNHVKMCQMSHQLNISRFEHKLIGFFNDYYLELPFAKLLFPAVTRNVMNQILARSSHLKVSVLGLCSMYLYTLRDSQCASGYVEGLDYNDLYLISLEYFQLNLRLNQAKVRKALENPLDPSTLFNRPEDVLDLIFADIFTFLVLFLQPFNLLPMIGENPLMMTRNTDGNIPNMVAICRGLKPLFGFAFKTLIEERETLKHQLRQSKIHGTNDWQSSRLDEINNLLLFYPSHTLKSSLREIRFPFPKLLAQQLNDWDKVNRLSKKEYDVIRQSIIGLDGSMDVCVTHKTISGLVRWIIIWDYDLLELIEAKSFFGLKILFYYCCFSLFLNFSMDNCNSELVNFVEFFKGLSFVMFSNWHHDVDRDMYTLVCQNFRLLDHDLDVLQGFLPHNFIKNDFSGHRDLSTIVETRSRSTSASSSTSCGHNGTGSPNGFYDIQSQSSVVGTGESDIPDLVSEKEFREFIESDLMMLY